MAQKLDLTVPDDLKNQLETYAKARGISISAAVRILLHQALAARLDGAALL